MVGLMAVLFLVLGFYLWLRGHWYLRVLAFIGLIPFGVCLFAIPFALAGADGIPVWVQCFIWPLGAWIAWIVSGIPIYVRRARERSGARLSSESAPYSRAQLRLFLAD